MIVPVIMAGGSGTRLWPLSRSMYPKQLLNLYGDQSLLQQTAHRVAQLSEAKPIAVCNEAHRFMVAEQLHSAGQLGSIILEPVGRNTAPAIALAALEAVKLDPQAILLVLAADHLIPDQSEFEKSAKTAIKAAEMGKLAAFGVVPTHPETGYGYINRGDTVNCGADSEVFQIVQFVEKPIQDVAQKYYDSGKYYWNSGMFVFQASRYLEELGRHAPEILSACQSSIECAKTDMDFIRVDAEAFKSCPDDSIDYAVMEKTDSAVVVPLDAGWSDIGSFSSLWDVSQKDANGNSSEGDVILKDTQNSLVLSEDSLVATLGVKDLVVVQTKDTVLVAHKDEVQNIKCIVSELKAQNRTEHLFHRIVYRPWGHYDSLESGERYQVKRITVKAGEKLSVQMHHHRAEHWVVVSGTALITIDGEDNLLSENESVYIPIGAVHSLSNPGKIPLELIEVQSGSYLGEDDIVRFEDRYGRN